MNIPINLFVFNTILLDGTYDYWLLLTKLPRMKHRLATKTVRPI